MSTVRKTVSHSEVETYLACERKHYYAYGLEITRKTQSDSLNVGTFGHEALDVYFTARLNGADFDTAKNECITWIGQQMMQRPLESDNINTALTAILFFFEAGGLMQFEILGVEKEFVLAVTDELEMPFVVDILVREISTGRIGVIDNKFIGRLYGDRDLELMPQLPKYLGGLRALGYPVDFAAYNELRTGGAKADTWRERYRFEEVPLTDTRITNTFREQVKASLRIQAKKQLVVDKGEAGMFEWSEDALRVQSSLVCGRCSFFNLCVAELNSEGAAMVLDSEYKKKERREFNGPASVLTAG